MKKPDIVKRLARRSGVTAGEAADRLDRAVHQILSNARKNKQTELPGLGTFRTGAGGGLEFEEEAGRSDD
ncbi:MAG TPA: HU family DNA-binding protein [Candidatus Limnocylindrales bacterium]|nr:HU family DNA-binding protein [Candidatus Limnocylindrales bacterium]